MNLSRSLGFIGWVGLSMVFAGCGAKTESGPSPNAGASTSHESARESYQFRALGCDTGKIEVTGTDRAETTKRLCDTLLSDLANRGCAENLREEFFQKRCLGQTWDPIRISLNMGSRVSTATRPISEPARQWDLEQLVRKQLQFVVVEKYSVSAKLATQVAPVAHRLGEDMMSCGFNQLGPKCLDELTVESVSNGELATIGTQTIFTNEIRLKGVAFPLVLNFSILRMVPDFQLGAVTISRAVKPRGTQSLKEYLSTETNFEALIIVTPAQDPEKTAWTRLENAVDIRATYHMSKGLLERTFATDRYGETKSRIAVAVHAAREILGASNNSTYQEGLVRLLADEILPTKRQMLDIAEALLKSNSSEVAEVAATIVFDDSPKRLELKPNVLRALSNNSWSTRNRAIQALAKNKNSPIEENLILARLDDTVEDVQKSVVAAALSFELTDAHFSSLKLLAHDESSWVRQQAAILLGRCRSPRAVSELISALNDPVENVENTIQNILQNKMLDENSVDDLKDLMRSETWTVRRDAVNLLAMIPANAATEALIRSLGDPAEEIRDLVVAQLTRRTLENRHVLLLAERWSWNWSTRRDITLLLGKIPGVKSSNAMIANLDDTVFEVQETIMTQLRNRPLSNASVSTLDDALKSRQRTTRRNAAELLGKIDSKPAREALEKQLAVEPVDEVKKQIQSSLQAIQ
ncbi:hypothetical protein BH10BDE1_BH10BDE1_33110 [soil metagenome]